jgi:hypothetical protein
MRNMAVPRLVALAGAMVLAAACGNPAQPDESAAAMPAEFTRTLAAGPAVFVLDRVERQSGEPIVIFDQTCDGVRYQHTVRDSVTLGVSGRARRAMVTQALQNGRVIRSVYVTATGKWARYLRKNAVYYKDGPSIVLTLTPDDNTGRAYDMLFRVRDDGALTDLASMGGSCPSGLSDGREAEFTYTRR